MAEGTARRFPREYQEVVVAAVLLVLTLALRLTINEFIVGRRGRAFLNPDFWPGTLLTFGIILGLIYLGLSIYRAIVYRRTGQHASGDGATIGAMGEGSEDVKADEPPIAEAAAEQVSVVGLLGSIVLLFLYIYLLRPVGFVVTTLAFCLAFLLFVGERRWWVLAAMPLVTTAVVLFVFTRLLVVPLPRGNGAFLTLSTYLY